MPGATSYSMSAVYLKQESALDNKKQEVLDYLGEYMDSNNKQSCVIWGEDTIMESAREYDGRILLVYGKDMWIDDCFALTGNVYEDEKYNAYQMINEESPSISMLYDEAKMLGCDFFILSTQRYTKALERKELGETADHIRTPFEGENTDAFPGDLSLVVTKCFIRIPNRYMSLCLRQADL